MSHHAQDERRGLADLFDELGPDAPTLCQGWSTGDLAAHLVVRERRPDAGLGIIVPALRGRTERIQRAVRDGRSWPELVSLVRSGPPRLMRLLDEPMNTVEFFVHQEDVRRAAPDWEPRSIPGDLEIQVWRRLRAMARLMRRRVPVGLTLDAPGYGRVTVRSGEPHVTLTGLPSELVLFAFGRQSAARVDMVGDPGAIERLRAARLGI